MEKWHIELDFLKEDEEVADLNKKPIKIVIADDDIEVHSVTKMILRDFTFEGHGLMFIDTYSGSETIEVLKENSDVAILFLDVVMEKNHSGLEVVEFLRKTLQNDMTRIVLRTGQPGEAPEDKIIREYDINDYRLKTEMTVQRLTTTLYNALRNYRDLRKIDKHRKGLEKIIRASSNLFEHSSMDDFFNGILSQLSSFLTEETDIMFIREGSGEQSGDGVITLDQSETPVIVAASGKYSGFIGKKLSEVTELSQVYNWLNSNANTLDEINYLQNGFIIKKSGKSNLSNYIFIEGDKNLYDFELINLFLTNYSVALDNYILNSMITNTQKEIIITLGEVVEKHFDDTGEHIRRISDMMYQFALLNQFSYSEGEMLKVASTMHDVGKIAIPDAILKKPGKLTTEEYEIVKTHAEIGHQILSKSKLEILKLAAEIALNHHERYDGSGYPSGLKGREIPISARMMAIVDVFDAMTHRRCYKEAESVDSTLAYIRSLKGQHFDPILVETFIDNIEKVVSNGQ